MKKVTCLKCFTENEVEDDAKESICSNCCSKIELEEEPKQGLALEVDEMDIRLAKIENELSQYETPASWEMKNWISNITACRAVVTVCMLVAMVVHMVKTEMIWMPAGCWISYIIIINCLAAFLQLKLKKDRETLLQLNSWREI